MKRQLLRFTLYAIIIYLTGSTLTLAVAAREPMWGNGTHFCGVSDSHPLWHQHSKRQDNRNYARRFAANLNRGEPRTVRMIYFTPNDRPYQAEVVQRMKDEIRTVQTFFADQMEAHGYGRATFRVETDSQGEPIVHRVDGRYPDSHYFDNTDVYADVSVRNEIKLAFDLVENVYLIVVDNRRHGLSDAAAGIGARVSKTGGEAMTSEVFNWFLFAHELGHAFGLQHDFSNNAYIMSYGDEGNRLSQCHAEYLSVHPYFNPDTPIEEGAAPRIELLSPHTYTGGETSVPIQLEISDPKGLQQVILHAAQPDNRWSVKACRGLGGKKETVIEFDYDGVIPSAHDPFYSENTSLLNPLVHPIVIEAIDMNGDVDSSMWGGGFRFVLFPETLQPLSKISGDNQAGLPNTALPAPFVVEVRNLDDGSPLFEVPISFTVTAGGGSLSVLHTETDKSGRAESVLTLGPNRGTNTVTVSAAGIEGTVTFTAVATAPVEIPDPKLRAAVEEALDKAPGTPIAPADMATLPRLEAENANISDLTGLEHATSLTNLLLGDTHVEGEGWINSNSIEDLSPLAGLTNLTRLNLSQNNITNLSPLAGLTNLTRLNIGGNNLSNISAVSGLINLTVLRLWRNNISDVSPVADLTYLTELNLDNNNITDISALSGLTNLTWLNLGSNAISDISALSGLTNLKTLWLQDNNISDLSPLVANTELRSGDTVRVLGNPLSDASIQTHIPALEARGVTVEFDDMMDSDDGDMDMEELAGFILEGHTTPVETVAIDPTGNILASGSHGKIILWDASVAQPRNIDLGEIKVWSVAFSPDSSILAIGLDHGMISLWDMGTGSPRHNVLKHTAWVESVAFSPDGRTLASGSGDNTVILWDVATWMPQSILEGHTGGVNSVAFSPDGQTLASGSDDKTVRLWDAVTGEPIDTFTEHTSWVRSVAFSPDGRTLASGSGDNTVILWDVATWTPQSILEGHTGGVNSVAFSPDGQTLASGSNDNTVRLWDAVTGEPIDTFTEHTSWVRSVAFSPYGILASGSGDQTVRLWEIAPPMDLEPIDSLDTDLAKAALDGHTDVVWSVAFSPDGQMLASGSWDQTVRLWDVETEQLLHILTGHTGSVMTVAFSPDGQTLVSGSWDRTIRLWDPFTGSPERTLTDHDSEVSSVVFSPDGKILANGSGDGTVRLWDTTTWLIERTLTGHEQTVDTVAFSPDGETLASGSRDRTIQLWDLQTGYIRAIFRVGSEVDRLAFSPDGGTLASGSRDHTVRLWDLQTGTAHPLPDQGGLINPVAFSPDGGTLAIGNLGISLLDTPTRLFIGPLAENIGTALSLAFSPDWKTLASGTETNQVLLWEIDLPIPEYELSIPRGFNLIHVPLKVTKATAADGRVRTGEIKFVSDLYDALGGASKVHFLATYDSQTQQWAGYFGPAEKGTPGDKKLTDDTGILANMIDVTSVHLTGNPLGANGTSTITLTPEFNVVGLPLRDSGINRVSDLLTLDGIKDNVGAIIFTDEGDWKLVTQAGDPSDIPIVGGQAFMLYARREDTVTISGEGWDNTATIAAAPPVDLHSPLTGIQVTDTTSVLGLKGSIVDEATSLNKGGFRVTVKNLSTGKAVTAVTELDKTDYRHIIVDIETKRAATVGDILEISAQSHNPFIGVEPLRYTVTAEDVKRSLIELPELVAYEIPRETELLANYPNPFNPETWIPYRLAEDAFVTLTIYDLNGQVVRTIDVGHRTAAVYENRSKAIYWDGRNGLGEQVASGVYFYHLSAGDFSATRKMVILK